jgi:hypothetical protein
MDFAKTEAAQDLSGLVGTIVDAVCTPDHQRGLDKLDQRFDKALWRKLIDADKAKFESKPGQHGRTSGSRTTDNPPDPALSSRAVIAPRVVVASRAEVNSSTDSGSPPPSMCATAASINRAVLPVPGPPTTRTMPMGGMTPEGSDRNRSDKKGAYMGG